MLTMVAHAQVGGALDVLPPRAVDDLLAAQLFVHLGAAALGCPIRLLLDGVSVRSDAAPVATSPLAVPKPGYRPMLSVQLRDHSAGVRPLTDRATDVHSAGGPRLSCCEYSPSRFFRAGRSASALCFCPGPGRPHGAYEWNKCATMYAMAAVATHKREEVSVEELRAMQYMHSSHSP